MYRILNLTGPALVVAFFGSGVSALAAQDAALQAVGEVMGYRRDVIGDSTAFDACRIFDAAGRPTSFPEGILPGHRPLLDRNTSRPCESERAGATAGVRVDSIALSDSAGTIYLTIRRGEWRHYEAYHLSPRPGRGWGVREVRLWGALRVTPVRPPG